MSDYSVGIDLGTTHCALSFLDLKQESGRGMEQSVLQLPQVTQPGTIESRPLLPSFLYIPNPSEFAAESLSLPWGGAPFIVGEFARSHGSKVPSRLVSSAKSWLSH
ncbi:MAG: Hsp70 family protein, partial [Verrucomicrobiota bacterium]|nr:Hsp70 family protein [Verrucomicrobiota bacterium]